MALSLAGLLCLAWLVWDLSGLGRAEPDYQIAYVGADILPEEGIEAPETAFAALGEDLNGDGVVTAQLHPYPTYDTIFQSMERSGERAGEELLLQAEASAVSLMMDLEMRDSFFFLLDDPEGFQETYGVLVRPDGTAPEEGDSSAAGCALPIEETPVFHQLSPRWQSALAGLSLARRGFRQDAVCAHPDGCEQLWAKLAGGA